MGSQFRNPDAFVLQVRRNGAFDHFGHVAADTTFFLGQTRAVNSSSNADAGSSDNADTGHGDDSVLLRGAKDGDTRGEVKTKPAQRAIFSIHNIKALAVHPPLE